MNTDKTTNWDKIYNQYMRECLNSDGDYSMSFIEWLKINYTNESPTNCNN